MKRLLMTPALVLLTFVVCAQVDKWDKEEDMIEIGVGGNVATITGDSPDYSSVGGIQIGIRTKGVNLSKKASLGIGMEFSMQGGKSDSYEYVPGGESNNRSTTTRLNYLNVPIVVRFQNDRHGFFAEAGLQPGLLLSAKKKGTATTNLKESFKKLDIGIPVRVGYKLKNKFGIALGVTPGLMNINKNSEVKKRNFVASLGLSYSL
jgi:opacity protein-like surface antigen